MTENVLITGASGRVARAVGKHLCKKGFDVIGVSRSVDSDDSSYTRTERLDLLEDQGVSRLEDIMEDVEAVFHLAWNVSAENFDTHEAWEPNMVMFENVMHAANRAGVPIFINGSSIHAGTGDIPAYTLEGSLEKTPEPYRSSIDPDSGFDLRKEQPGKPLDPRDENPDSPYGWSKIITERATRKAVEDGDFRIGVSIRIGGVNTEDLKELEGEPYYSSLYWSHLDLGRTIEDILTADLEEKEGYSQFYGVSDNEGRIFNIENPFIGSSKD